MIGADTHAHAPRVLAELVDPPSKGLFRRRKSNRRVQVQRRSLVVVLADGLGAFGRAFLNALRVTAKVLAVVGFVAGIAWGGRWAVEHVMASPRFALRDVQISPAAHVPREDVLALAGVKVGDRLLAVDTDAVAARIATHPWVAAARVKRQLPSALAIDITERKAAATVALEGLYLIDEGGQTFKRATMEEAKGLPVITGVERAHYVDAREASEAVFRGALEVLTLWQSHPKLPPLSEISVDARFGFTLFLLDGGGEIRLGRGDYGKKLARLDQILEAVKVKGAKIDAVRLVHLDDGVGSRVPVKLKVPGS